MNFTPRDFCWLRRVIVFGSLVINSVAAAALLERGDVVFADVQLKAVFHWTAATGMTNHLAPFALRDARGGIAMDRKGNIFGLLNTSGPEVAAEFYRLDPASSSFVRFSAGGIIKGANRMIVSSDQKSLIVTAEPSQTTMALFRVDLATGQQTLLTTNFHSKFMDVLPALERPWVLAVVSPGKIVMGDNSFSHVVRFSEDGSNREFLAEIAYPFLLTGIALDSDGFALVSGLNQPNKILKLDMTTGQTTPVGNGSLVVAPFDITQGLDGTYLVADPSADAIIRVDPNTGEETVLIGDIPAPRTPCMFLGAEEEERPVLAIRGFGNRIRVSWSDPANAWRLETAADLSPGTTWTAAQGTEISSGAVREIEFDTTSVSGWFRLLKP